MSKHVFRKETLAFLARVHHLTLQNGGLADYERLREELFTQNEHVAICAGALHDVIQATCNFTGQASEPQWMRLGDIADAATCEDHNERSRLRALATVVALWSNDVVRHYEWEQESRAFLSALRVCARKYPNFCRDFAPSANSTMLRRHKQSFVDNKVPAIGEHYMRGRIQSPRSPLIAKDVTHMADDYAFAATPNNGDIQALQYRLTHDCVPCSASITIGGKTLQQLRGQHYQGCVLGLDRFGLLVPRRYAVGANPHCTFCQTDGIWPSPLTATSYSSLAYNFGDTERSSLTASSGTQSASTSIETEDSILDNASSSGTPPFENTETTASLPDYSCFEKASARQRSSHAIQASHDSPSANTPWSLVDFEQTQSMMSNPVERFETPLLLGPNVSGATSRLSSPSIEHILLEKYRASILLSFEKPQVGRKFDHSGSKWSRSNVKMAKIFADTDSYLGIGTASCETEAHVMYCSASRFCELANSGAKFSRPVVIKETFSDQGLHTLENFAELLTDAYRKKPVTLWSPARQHLEEVPMEMLLERLISSQNISRNVRRSVPPLSIDLPALVNAQAPSLTMLNRYRLLQVLVNRGGFFSCHQTQPSPWGPFDSISFNHFCMKNAFSGPYTATAADVWERTLFGLRFCLIVPTSTMDSQAWEDFATQGTEWSPNGRERLIILTEEDILFMPSGACVVYAFHAPETCLVESGLVWDSHNIVETLRSMNRLGINADRGIIRKPLLQRAPELVAELHELLRENWARFAGSQPAEDFQRIFGEALNHLGFELGS